MSHQFVVVKPEGPRLRVVSIFGYITWEDALHALQFVRRGIAKKHQGEYRLACLTVVDPDRVEQPAQNRPQPVSPPFDWDCA